MKSSILVTLLAALANAAPPRHEQHFPTPSLSIPVPLSTNCETHSATATGFTNGWPQRPSGSTTIATPTSLSAVPTGFPTGMPSFGGQGRKSGQHQSSQQQQQQKSNQQQQQSTQQKSTQQKWGQQQSAQRQGHAA